MANFSFQSRFDVSVEQLFALHERAHALPLLTPPWVPLEYVRSEGPGGLIAGTRHHLQLRFGPVKIPWIARQTEYQRNVMFTDEQVRGPMQQWVHRHCFEAIDEQSSILREEITFNPPPVVPKSTIEKRLHQTFVFRHERTHRLLNQIKLFSAPRMKILISGATGLIGTQLVRTLEFLGHEVYRLTRKPNGPKDLAWDPAKSQIHQLPSGLDAVIHLAGENVASEPWTDAVKARIAKSRIDGTRFLVDSLIRQGVVPGLFLSASAIGYYGRNRPSAVDEASEPGNSFLARTAIDWEKATTPLDTHGCRVIHLRFGVVMDPRGGALAAMRLPFLMGLGGPLGSGQHFMSLIGMEDVIGILLFLLKEPSASGPYNLVCEEPVTNQNFVKLLARLLHRPAFLRVPESLLKLLPNRMAEELLLSSLSVNPRRLQNLGYEFIHPTPEKILGYCLGKS